MIRNSTKLEGAAGSKHWTAGRRHVSTCWEWDGRGAGGGARLYRFAPSCPLTTAVYICDITTHMYSSSSMRDAILIGRYGYSTCYCCYYAYGYACDPNARSMH